MARKRAKKEKVREIVTLKQNGRDMPVAIEKDSITLWPGYHGWTTLSKDEALALARVINERFNK